MEREPCLLNGKSDVSNSKDQGPCAIEDNEALHVVGQLLSSLLSDMLTKRTVVREKKRPAQFTAEQKEVLEKTFAEEQFVKGSKMTSLRQEVGLSKEQVSKWFMHRRALERRKKKVMVGVQESSTVIFNVSQVTTTEGTSIDRKKRVVFTAEQIQRLESAFAEEQFIRGATLTSLVQEVGLSKAQVSRWFINRRALERRRKDVKVDVEESSPVMETSSVMANVSQVSPTEEAPVVDKKRSDVVEDNGHKSLEAKRISLTDPQKTGLEKAFAEERFLEKGREARLAEYLGLSMVQVSGWFRNQRAKMRKEAFVRGNVEEKKYLPLKPMAIRSLPVEQRSELEKAFAEGQFIGKKRMARITEDLGLSKKQVTTWFKYQRAKMRKKAAAEREVKGEQYPPGKNFMNPFTIGQREELEKASGLDAQLEFPKLKNAVVQEKKKKSVKIRQQEGQVKKVRDDHDQLIPVQESSTETLADANVVKGEAGAGRKDGRCSSRRSLLTTFQAVGLAEAFAKEEYIVGGKLVRLAEDLGMSKKQVNAWFCSKRVLKRKKEETAIRKMVEGVAVWPPPGHHPLPGNVAAADSTSDSRGGDLKEQGVSAEGNVSESEFITSLEENIGRVERKVEEVMASIAVPLLSMPLSQQEMLMCLARLNSSPWSFGSKAALLLVFTDQIVISVRGGLAGLFQAEGQPPRDVEFVRKTLVAEHLVKKLGEAWKKLFIGIHTAPHQLKLSVDALATLEKTLHRHYRELCALAPNLALHLASKEAALVFIPNYISKEFIATVISKVDAKVKETVVSTLTSQRT